MFNSSRIFGVFDVCAEAEALFRTFKRGVEEKGRPEAAWHTRQGVAGLLVDTGCLRLVIGGYFVKSQVADMEAQGFSAVLGDTCGAPVFERDRSWKPKSQQNGTPRWGFT